MVFLRLALLQKIKTQDNAFEFESTLESTTSRDKVPSDSRANSEHVCISESHGQKK